MTALALSENVTFWTVALGVGAVAIAVVIALMMMLLSFLKDIENGAAALIETSSEILENTAATVQLGNIAPALELIADEALMQGGYLQRKVCRPDC